MSSTTSRWWPSALNLALKDRTIRMRVSPTPITFAERRSVLQYLQKRGEIQVFRQVVNRKGHFLAVAKDAQTVADLREEEYHVYHASVFDKMPDMTYTDLSKPEDLDITKATVYTDTANPKSNREDGRVQKRFTIRVKTEEETALNHNQEQEASMSMLNGPWPESFTSYETLMSNILKASLPSNLTAEGFSRWDYDLYPAAKPSAKANRLAAGACLPSRMGRSSSKTPSPPYTSSREGDESAEQKDWA